VEESLEIAGGMGMVGLMQSGRGERCRAGHESETHSMTVIDSASKNEWG
jgi:hypothetical protein